MVKSQLAFAYAGSGEIGATMAILPCIVRSPFRWDAVDKAVCAVGIVENSVLPVCNDYNVPKVSRVILAISLLLSHLVSIDEITYNKQSASCESNPDLTVSGICCMKALR